MIWPLTGLLEELLQLQDGLPLLLICVLVLLRLPVPLSRAVRQRPCTNHVGTILLPGHDSPKLWQSGAGCRR